VEQQCCWLGCWQLWLPPRWRLSTCRLMSIETLHLLQTAAAKAGSVGVVHCWHATLQLRESASLCTHGRAYCSTLLASHGSTVHTQAFRVGSHK
jgi:hypothetical protein